MRVEIRDQDIFQKKDRVVARRVAGEFFLIPIKGDIADLRSVFVLHGVGDAIWASLDGKKTISAIGAELVDAYDVSADKALADIKELLGNLIHAELVEKVT